MSKKPRQAPCHPRYRDATATSPTATARRPNSRIAARKSALRLARLSPRDLLPTNNEPVPAHQTRACPPAEHSESETIAPCTDCQNGNARRDPNTPWLWARCPPAPAGLSRFGEWWRPVGQPLLQRRMHLPKFTTHAMHLHRPPHGTLQHIHRQIRFGQVVVCTIHHGLHGQ